MPSLSRRKLVHAMYNARAGSQLQGQAHQIRVGVVVGVGKVFQVVIGTWQGDLSNLGRMPTGTM